MHTDRHFFKQVITLWISTYWIAPVDNLLWTITFLHTRRLVWSPLQAVILFYLCIHEAYECRCVWRLFLFRMGIRESQKWSWRTISELAEGSHFPISSLYYPNLTARLFNCFLLSAEERSHGHCVLSVYEIV